MFENLKAFIDEFKNFVPKESKVDRSDRVSLDESVDPLSDFKGLSSKLYEEDTYTDGTPNASEEMPKEGEGEDNAPKEMPKEEPKKEEAPKEEPKEEVKDTPKEEPKKLYFGRKGDTFFYILDKDGKAVMLDAEEKELAESGALSVKDFIKDQVKALGIDNMSIEVLNKYFFNVEEEVKDDEPKDEPKEEPKKAEDHPALEPMPEPKKDEAPSVAPVESKTEEVKTKVQEASTAEPEEEPVKTEEGELEFEDMLWKEDLEGIKLLANAPRNEEWRNKLSPRKKEILQTVLKRKELGESREVEVTPEAIEEGIKDVKKQFEGQVAPELLQAVIDADTTKTKKYVKWVLKNAVESKITDQAKVLELMALAMKFEKYLAGKGIPAEKKDIYAQSPEDVQALIKKLDARLDTIKQDGGTTEFMEGTKVIGETPKALIIELLTEEAALKVGALRPGYQWCTMTKVHGGRCRFEDYKKEGWIQLVVIPKDESKDMWATYVNSTPNVMTVGGLKIPPGEAVFYAKENAPLGSDNARVQAMLSDMEIQF